MKVIRDLADVNIAADENQLQIVIRNILSNAIKFTHEKGYIKVSLRSANDKVQLSIQDTGIGIPSEQLKNVFLFPPSRKGTNGEKGTGIGLSLCKELMEKNGGTIHFKSEEGGGTEVIMEFPLLAKETKIIDVAQKVV